MNLPIEPPARDQPEAVPRDAIAAVIHRDPYPWYARLAFERPLAFEPGLGLWVAAGGRVCAEVLASPHCRVRPVGELVPRALEGGAAGELWVRWARMNDGERHHALRRAIETALAGGSRARFEALAAHAARALLVDAGAQPARAWLDDYMDRLAPHAIARWLGFGEEHVPMLAAATHALVRATAPGATPEAFARGEPAARALTGATKALLASGAGDSDALAVRLERQVRAEGLGDEDSVANAIAMLWQSFDATAGGIGNTVVALARRPELRARVVTAPDRVPALVAESLRFDPPAQNTRRYAQEGFELAGLAIAPGDAVLVVLAAASRDPSAVDQPDRFELDRERSPRIAFGAGVHRCPGDTAARAIIAAGVRALLERGLEWDALAEVTYRRSFNVRVPDFGAA